MITSRTTCRVCEHPIVPVFYLGDQYVSAFPKIGEDTGERVPLSLALCQYCGLVQLTHTVDIPHEEYWYRSGTNQTMRDVLADVAQSAENWAGLRSGDAVLDIGCNDGTLLGSYLSAGIIKVGVDPSLNLTEFSRGVADEVHCAFFSADLVGHQKFKIITSVAMFYDLDDPNKFVSDVVKVLRDDGLWVIQMNYLPTMLERRDYGNICHEHLQYNSLEALEFLLGKHNLKVVHVNLNEVNGGSFRVYIRKESGYSVDQSVGEFRAKEANFNLFDPATYGEFAFWCNRVRSDVTTFVYDQVNAGYSVGVYGASTKGNTMLQYLGLDHKQLKYAVDRNPDKWGRVTVGTNIPIVSEREFRINPVHFLLVLPWHFLTEFKEREDVYLRGGGRFIVPLPHLTII